eukprot:TRINITY_DN914_c0_g1_i1.p1 TRINITY_DN914_c0_g1~~TRINITY_DN914_c0_g1_i1.p1  ORF type:complete len:120 (+),score=7.76 TRINITY_DN914_c0_g1_i1:598-957(+)
MSIRSGFLSGCHSRRSSRNCFALSSFGSTFFITVSFASTCFLAIAISGGSLTGAPAAAAAAAPAAPAPAPPAPAWGTADSPSCPQLQHLFPRAPASGRGQSSQACSGRGFPLPSTDFRS